MITLLAVADPEIGLGHLYRCDALAQAFLIARREVQLIVSCTAGEAWLAERKPETPYSISSWNTEQLVVDDAIRGSSMIVVDAYSILPEVWASLRTATGRLVVFDDVGEKPGFQGIVVNGGPGAHLIEYTRPTGQKHFLGLNYQVLRRPFWRPTRRSVRPSIERVGAMVGGTDHRHLLDTVATQIRSGLSASVEIVAIGTTVDRRAEIDYRGMLTAKQLKELFGSLDLLVSAAGQSVAEAVSCELPTIMIQTAANQRMNVAGWGESGAGAFAGCVDTPGWISGLAEAVEDLIPAFARESMVCAARKLGVHTSTERLRRALDAEVTP